MRNYNHKHDTLDKKDFIFQGATKVTDIDLRPKFPPIFDQGQLGSCTANGILGAFGYLMIACGITYVQLSRLFLYFEERSLEGTVNQDSGAMIRDGLKVLQTLGCALETDFPYDISKFTNKPSAKVIADAAKYKINSYSRIMNLNSLKSALAQGRPVVFGFNVYESFEGQEVANTGIVPMPNTATEKLLGGHAVCAVGYDDAKQWVIVRNSWGTGWGDKGYCYMPYAMFTGPIVTDMWVAKLNTPKTTADVPFLDAVAHYVSIGCYNSPDYWNDAYKRFTAGEKPTLADANNFMLAIQKAAARDITETEL